jgi:ERCC4-related helicase
LVWFITPTIALAEQQHSVISQQLPAYQVRLLSGNDNVDHWSSQKIWDSILYNIRIVVSTPQVLLDAMSSGFVRLTKMSLLVIDEGV